MTNTIKLYDNYPYQTEFKATILSAEPAKKGWTIVLDQTLFFPEEGGQSADDGWLGVVDQSDASESAADGVEAASCKWTVTDVQIRDGVIYHSVIIPGGSKTAEPGMEVCGRINWQKRFSNMQNHTGEHILSGLIHAKYGFENVGFHLSENIVTFDQSGYLSPEQLAEIEQEANRIVWGNLPVTAQYLSPEDAKGKTYRSKIEIDGDVRLVTIGEASDPVDVCACCAPHVARTGEIGLIKILRSEKYKGGTRLTILCGERALAEVSKRQEQIEHISHLLRAKQDEAYEAVSHLYDENVAQKERLIGMQEEKIRRLAEEALAARTVSATEEVSEAPGGASTAPDGASATPGPGENIWIFTEGLDPLPHRNLVNFLTERVEGYVGVFLPADEPALANADKQEDITYRFIIGSRTQDSREVAAILREQYGAKGGGKPEMVQGSVCTNQEDLLKILP